MNRLAGFTIKNIRGFYLLTIFTNGWFIMGNWLFFWLKFMTSSEIGVFDAIAFGIGLLSEIPSGAVADLLGKKRTLILANVLSTIGTLVMAISQDKYHLLLGNTILFIGRSFYSGAAEALAYDTLVEEKQENLFEKVMSNANLLALINTVAAAAVGGILYGINERLPWFAWAIYCFCGLLISFTLIEPRIDSIKFSLANYFHQLITGFKELGMKSLRPYLVAFILLSGIFFMYEAGLMRPTIAISFGFDGVNQSLALALVTLVAGVSLAVLPLLRKVMNDRLGMVFLLLVMCVGFFATTLPLGMIGGFVVLSIIAIAGNFASPWISIVINKEIQSKYRATTISTLALFTKLPYVLTAIMTGILIDQGNLNVFSFAIALVLLAGAVLTAVLARAY